MNSLRFGATLHRFFQGFICPETLNLHVLYRPVQLAVIESPTANNRIAIMGSLKCVAGRCFAVLLTGLVIVCALSASSLAASLGRDWNFERSVKLASLVFEGKVIAIEFHDSKPLAKSGVSIPHTFVTYDIKETIRGRTSLQQITLRFLGGWSQSNGRIMVVPHAPLFKIGNRGILFVSKNGAAACPLIGCSFGRFRVFDNKVYSDSGLAVRITPGGSIRFGPERMPSTELQMEFPPSPAARLKELKEQLGSDKRISSVERARLVRRLKDMSTTRTISRGREVANRGSVIPSSPRVSVTDFSAAILAMSKKYPTSGPQVVSVVPNVDFEFPELQLLAAQPPSRISRPPTRPLTREQQLLKQNRGNPVLGVQQ